MKRNTAGPLSDVRKLKTSKCKDTPTSLVTLLENLKAAFTGENVNQATVEKVFFDGVREVPMAEWSGFAFFDPSRYSRNLLAAQERFSLILLCWEPGQHTPVHSHQEGCTSGRNSLGFVLSGELLLTEYSEESHGPGEGRSIVSVSLLTADKSPVMREEASAPRGYHVLENVNKTRQAISVHLYTPALLDCCWKDKHNTIQSIPVCYTPITSDAINSSLRSTGLLGAYYVSFDALAALLTDELRRGKDLQRMTRILESIRFNPKEFRRYAHWSAGKYTRNLVGYNEAFTLLMLCWDRGQESPIHDHAGSHCFMKILEGELHEVRYDASNPRKLSVKGITHLREEAVAYIDDTQGVHKMVNPSLETGAISLHIYIPPYKTCSIFNLRDGTRCQTAMHASNTYNDKPYTQLMLGDGSSGVAVTTVNGLVEDLQRVFETESPDSAALNAAVEAVLNRVQFVSSEWVEHVHFSEHNYTRMLLTLHDRFSLVLICWNPKQGCPRHSHDHSPHNTMFVKSLTGSIVFERFADASPESATRDSIVVSDELPCLTMSNAELGFHATRNPSDQFSALTLHLYTPPMLDCTHADGVAPVVYCEKGENVQMTPTKVKPLLWLDGGLRAYESATNSKLAACASVFCNFQQLMDTLRSVFSDEDPSRQAKRVHEVLEKFEFNPKEIEQYKSFGDSTYSRRRVVMHPLFEVYIITWRSGQETPIHDHGPANSWIKVLEGELADTHFSRPERGLPPYVIQSNVLKRGDVSALPSPMIHQTKALGENCCSVTVYSPPYDEFSCYCSKTGHATISSTRGPADL